MSWGKGWRYGFVALCVLWSFSCDSDSDVQPTLEFPDVMEIPSHFPALSEPSGNEYTPARWELGKKLFFETALSIDGSISCASCHAPEKAFSDTVALSLGSNRTLGRRNSPTLANVGYHPYLTREGGVPTLEMQILVPIQEHDEFNHNVVLIVDSLSRRPDYQREALAAYGRDFDAFVLTRALSCFERSLVSGWSKFDSVSLGLAEYSPPEERGEALFFSDRLACESCHGGFNFTDYTFQNNGLYEDYEDEGRFRLTGEEEDRALFKVPGLRNIALTGPYMHDGSIPNLEEVVDHYSEGIKNHPNLSPRLQPLNLSIEEKEELIAFLHTLTDAVFINNPNFKE